MLTPTIEQRLTDVEAVLTDLPELFNIRFERFDIAQREHTLRFEEISGRLNLIDRLMGTLTRDLRDMRGGVTRQLIAQDHEIAAIKADVAVIKGDVAVLKADVAELKTGMTKVEAGISEILKRLPAA